MSTTLLSCVLCFTLINLMVDCTRTPKQGHHMLSGISLESSEFEQHVRQMASRIEQLQILDDGQPNQAVQRYVLPVFLYVHEATRISQSPVYLALNVQSSGPDGKDFFNYLQIVEIYDERYHQPLMQLSPQTPFTYPNKIQPFNPTNELDRHYVIAGLRDPKTQHEVMTRLSLVFVESIRFYSVRRAVQQALHMKEAVDFTPMMPMIRQWEAATRDLVYQLEMNRNYIEVDQKLPVTLNQNVFSISVFHLNAAAQVNMWFLYQFIRCNNQYHQQTQDADSSCDVDTWSQTKWKVGCKNANGRDVPVRNLKLQNCAQMCQQSPSCNHFSWKNNDCYLKNGIIVATEEKKTYDLHDTCGFKTSRKNFIAVNKYGGQQSFSSTPGYNGGKQYGSGRMPNTMCSNNIRRGPSNTLVLTDTQGQQHQVANRYGWSQHNYPCRGLKTGLVLYPADVMHKNTVLLLCDGLFYYHQMARGNRHDQMMRWYYNIYRSSKQFSLVSGFSVQPDGTFQFNNWQQQSRGLYTDNVNNMDACEQDVIRQVVNGRIDSHTV